MRLTAVFALLTSATALSISLAVAAAEPSRQTSQTAASESFVVRSYASGPDAQQLLARCRKLRREIEQAWLGDARKGPWRPRCEVVLHASRASYAAAVGRGSAQTTGSSLVEFSYGRPVLRRIDLLVDESNRTNALGHELSHMVLGVHFHGRRIPRWADEGIAVLADAAEKQTLHQRDLHDALQSGSALRLGDLLTLQQFSSSDQVAAFYGQSLSLVCFLAERESPERLVTFLERAMETGYDRALRDVYAIEGVAHLERLWRSEALASAARARVHTVGFETVGK